MPELPEIETVRLQLQRVLPGKILHGFDVRNQKTVHGDLQQVVGQKVQAVLRKAKVLLIVFENNVTLAFHFKMSGQLINVTNKPIITNPTNTTNDFNNRIVGGHPTADFVGTLPSSHTRVVFYLDNSLQETKTKKQTNSNNQDASSYDHDSVLYFNDQRMFGWVKIVDQMSVDQLFSEHGPEPFDISGEEFIERLPKTKRPIKVVLMDQSVVSGPGNIYVDDALWEAAIHPSTPTNLLSREQILVLFEKLKLVLAEGIQYGGATAADAKYINLHGLGGTYQEHFRVYDQEGKPCKTCGTAIEKIVLGGRGHTFVPHASIIN